MFDAEPIKRKLRIAGQCYSRISGLSVEGFKAFGDTQNLRIAPITLVFGVNSSGKSALIQSLALMREMLYTDDSDVRYPKLGGRQIDLGGFEQYVSKWSNKNEVCLTLSFEDKNNPSTTYEYGISIGRNRLDDNQFIRFSEYGRDLEYSVNRIRVSGNGLRMEMQLSESLDGIESPQYPLSYHMKWDEFEANEAGVAFLRAPLSLQERLRKRMGGVSVPSDNTEKFYAALKWVLDQEYLMTYLASGKQCGLNEFIAGGYFKDEGGEEGDGVFFRPTSKFNSRSAARNSLRDFLEIDYVSEGGGFRFANDKDFEEIWHIATVLIPTALSKLSSEAFRKCYSLLSSMKYLGPIREIPDRNFLDRFSHLDKELDSSGMATYVQIGNDPRLLEKVNRWLSGSLFRKQYKFRSVATVPIGTDVRDERKELRFYEQASGGDIELGLKDVGSGISQIIPVITLCLGNEMKTLIVEQPELHMHPSGAAEMGDLLIESALVNENTIIAETHSEHLILRILKRIRQTYEGTLPEHFPPITSDDVSVVFVQPRKDGRGSEIVQIPVTEDGDILFGWPEGFMPDGLQELF